MQRRREQPLLNGFRVPPAYFDYWRDHPEIGLPVSPLLADGSQVFENARLDWKDGQVVATWISREPSFSYPTW